MPEIIKNRVCAELEGEFVVLLLGARISNPLKFWKWLQLSKAMRAMRVELAEHPGDARKRIKATV